MDLLRSSKDFEKMISKNSRNFNRDMKKKNSDFNKKIKKDSSDFKKMLKKNEILMNKFTNASIMGDIRSENRIPIPAKRRKEVYDKYNRRCDVCISGKPLEIHHVGYNSKTKKWKNRDNSLKNLRLLCRNHHGMIHKKKDKKPYDSKWNKKHKKK